MSKESIMKKLKLDESDFKPKLKDSTSDIEMAIVELANLIDETIEEHENALIEIAAILADMEN